MEPGEINLYVDDTDATEEKDTSNTTMEELLDDWAKGVTDEGGDE
jgi:hypothetical protein